MIADDDMQQARDVLRRLTVVPLHDMRQAAGVSDRRPVLVAIGKLLSRSHADTMNLLPKVVASEDMRREIVHARTREIAAHLYSLAIIDLAIDKRTAWDDDDVLLDQLSSALERLVAGSHIEPVDIVLTDG